MIRVYRLPLVFLLQALVPFMTGCTGYFAGLARSSGFISVRCFDRLDEWQRQAAEALTMSGPRSAPEGAFRFARELVAKFDLA